MISQHFLVKDWCNGGTHRWHHPHPVSRTTAPQPLFIFAMFYEGVRSCMMICRENVNCLTDNIFSRKKLFLNTFTFFLLNDDKQMDCVKSQIKVDKSNLSKSMANNNQLKVPVIVTRCCWKLQRTDTLISTSALSFQSEADFLVSNPILVATGSNMLQRPLSHRSLAPISVPMYQPLNGMAVNSRPPQYNIILATAG